MSRYAHALHATLSSHLIRSRLIARVFPSGPFLLLSPFLFRCLLIWCHPFLILVPSHFPSFLIHRLHTFFSFFRSPPYRSPLRDVRSILSHLREVTQHSPSPHFLLGRRLLHSFLIRQTRRPIFPSGLLLPYTFDVFYFFQRFIKCLTQLSQILNLLFLSKFCIAFFSLLILNI